MVEYVIRYHKGTPSDSVVVFSETIYAENDIEADKIRQQNEALHMKTEYDFNLLSQAEYLRKQKII
jgi:hypothetical protein